MGPKTLLFGLWVTKSHDPLKQAVNTGASGARSGPGALGLGLGFWGFGFWVLVRGLGFRILGLGLGFWVLVQGLGFRILGLGLGFWGLGFGAGPEGLRLREFRVYLKLPQPAYL